MIGQKSMFQVRGCEYIRHWITIFEELKERNPSQDKFLQFLRRELKALEGRK